MAGEQKQEFRNPSRSIVGVVKIDRKGDLVGSFVPAGGTVFLSEEEQQATADAPANPKDSPFESQTYSVPDGEGHREVTSPMLVAVEEVRAIPARTIPGMVAAPPAGSFMPGEVTGTEGLA